MVDHPTVAKRLRQTEHKEAGRERAARRNVSLTGYATLPNGATLEVNVIDLSYDGCKIESQTSLLPGVRFKLSILGLQGSLEAGVRWCRNGVVGLQFNPMDELSPGQPPQKPREQQRIKVTAQLSIRRLGRAKYVTQILDFTPSGCKVEFVERPKVGEIIQVKFEGLEAIEGDVRWVEGFFGGIQFKRSIYPSVFQMLLAKLQGDGQS